MTVVESLSVGPLSGPVSAIRYRPSVSVRTAVLFSAYEVTVRNRNTEASEAGGRAHERTLRRHVGFGVTMAAVRIRMRLGGGDREGRKGEEQGDVLHAVNMGRRDRPSKVFLFYYYNKSYCDKRRAAEHGFMILKSSRRGIWVPRACALPAFVLLLVMIAFDRCSRN